MSDENRRIRVLLVDDEEDLVTLTAARLKRRDMDVVTATTGAEALALDEAHTFDVAILDLKMPQMDGVAVMSELKARHPQIETIMLTGHGTLESALEVGKLAAFKYLIKPCDFDDLLKAIQDAYEHRRTVLHELYEAELIKGMDHFQSAHDIMRHSDELRKKYEQD